MNRLPIYYNHKHFYRLIGYEIVSLNRLIGYEIVSLSGWRDEPSVKLFRFKCETCGKVFTTQRAYIWRGDGDARTNRGHTTVSR